MYSDSFPTIKFTILFIIFSIPIWIWSPGIKWKLILTVAVAIGLYLALIGKSMRGVTPISRRGY